MCLLFIQVISNPLGNLAPYIWVKEWETSTRMTKTKTLSRNLNASIDGITKSCRNMPMFKHLPAYHHERSELTWVSSALAYGLPTYLT